MGTFGLSKKVAVSRHTSVNLDSNFPLLLSYETVYTLF